MSENTLRKSLDEFFSEALAKQPSRQSEEKDFVDMRLMQLHEWFASPVKARPGHEEVDEVHLLMRELFQDGIGVVMAFKNPEDLALLIRRLLTCHRTVWPDAPDIGTEENDEQT